MEDFLNYLRTLKTVFKSSELKNRKERDLLAEAVKSGDVLKLKNGIYCLYENQYEVTYEFHDIVPDGVLCLWSAWSHYGFTDMIPYAINIAVPFGKKVTVPEQPIFKVHYRKNEQYELGLTTETKNGIPFKIYDMERCVCDAFKYRNKIGIDVTAEIFNSYISRPDVDIEKLLSYAKKMKVYNLIKNILQFK